MKLLLATNNQHKIEEIKAIFADTPLTILSAKEIPGLPEDVEETGTTFAENAMIKATAFCKASGLWTLADDSGLCVDALHGAPGVYSARYAGPGHDQPANNRKLLEELKNVTNRAAHFSCVLALRSPEKEEAIIEGICPGTIAHAPRGEGGFGYDPLFIPDGYQQTFGELPASVKNRLSHRAKALQAFWETWGQTLASR